MVSPSLTSSADPPGWRQNIGTTIGRAREAKINPPEAGLKCPRCESADTKFCYFNNYSLSQPRHFCKACRRYWTRGGTLRNIPVGGGCRRNKRHRTAAADHESSSSNREISSTIPPHESLSFFPSLHFVPDYYAMNSAANFEQWRVPIVESLEATPPLSVGLYAGQTQDNASAEGPIKREEDDPELGQEKNCMGIWKNDPRWEDGSWADISFFPSARFYDAANF